MKNNNTMKMENKIKDIIDMLEEALSFEDWRKVENAQKRTNIFIRRNSIIISFR